PFARPRSISQKVSFSDRSPNQKDIQDELHSVLRQFQSQLEEVHCLTHQLELILHTDDNLKSSAQHTFPCPTDQTDVMEVGINSMLSDLTVTADLEVVKLKANPLVANTRNYHIDDQRRLDNLRVL
ncbi:MAG: hypothetical protein ABEK50_07300, partial [bacterium]